MKAFLSHSSLDKEFVQEVADQLGRINCVFDKYSFEIGMDFSESIVKHLGNSSVFIFFASKNSINSLWCKYEQEEAFYLKIKQQLGRAIVFIIQDGISVENIPEWLRRCLIRFETSPAIISREVYHQIIKSSDKYQSRLFLGRSKERELMEDVITPVDGRKPPKTFAIFGLPGIGRRSLIKSSVTELFSLSRVIEIEIEAGDNANSLCIKIVDKAESYSCQEELREKIDEIKNFSASDALQRVLINIEKLALSGELPIFVDAGGCLKNNGTFKDYINELISSIGRYKNAYLIFILSRRVNKENEPQIECLPVEPLQKKSISQILSKLATDEYYRFSIEKEQIEELSDYINGYPPSAYYAAKESSIYGVPSLISDKRKLTQFSKKKFVAQIRDQKLSDSDKAVLRILSLYSPLPLNVLLVLYENLELSNAHDQIYELIDCSLIRVIEGQYYSISDPIKGSVRDVLGISKKDEIKKVVLVLEKYINGINSDFERKLEFSRVLYRMNFILGRSDDAGLGIKLRGDFIKLLEQAYHQQNYKEAVTLGREAVEECPDDSSARTFLIKALVQEELWDEADERINDLYPTDEYRNVYYLRGFLERKRGRIPEAIEGYEKAELHGRKGISLYRELAHCYIMIDKYDMAKKHIDKALSVQSDNSHILDMGAKLEIKHGNENDAINYLDKLEILDVPKYFHMRKSSFFLRFGPKDDALDHAKKSIDAGG